MGTESTSGSLFPNPALLGRAQGFNTRPLPEQGNKTKGSKHQKATSLIHST